MRVRKSVIAATLCLSAALGGLSATGPAAATGGDGLVNIYVQDVLTGNQTVLFSNLTVAAAAAICGITADVLSADLLSSNHATCGAKTTSLVKSWVSYL